MNHRLQLRPRARAVVRAALFCVFALIAAGCENFAFFDLIEAPGGGGGPLAISPISATLLVNSSCVFTASGGTPPYVFTVTSGGGSIDADSGLYTAPAEPGRAVIQVTDSGEGISEAEALCVE